MLVMNYESMHKIDIVKVKIKEYKTKVSIIPGGLTRYLQSLDVCINKLFKDELKKRYTKYWKVQKDTKTKILRRYNKLGWRNLVWW